MGKSTYFIGQPLQEHSPVVQKHQNHRLHHSNKCFSYRSICYEGKDDYLSNCFIMVSIIALGLNPSRVALSP